MPPLLPWLLLLVLVGENLGLTGLPASVFLKDGDTFDYIVVGAGGAGAPAAARLALTSASVLLVEAGGDPNLISMIPGVTVALLGSDLDWKYPTVPNNISCLSALNKQCCFNRGKCLGGSTSINYMMYVRGNRCDYDNLGILGWAWKDLEPYFLKYEGLQDLDNLPSTSIPYHNTSGTMKIGFFTDSENSWHSRTIKGLQTLKFPFNPDVNAESQIGVSQVIGYVHKGERMSTARGYLTRDDVKKTLKVAKNTRCTGVILNKKNEAIGITVESGLLQRKLRVYAKKEVVLSAGTLSTPQILMLSGIGPAAHLKSLGIDVRADLPVGDNLSDHVFPAIFIQVDPCFGVPAPNPFVLGLKSVQAVQWLATKSGPLASNGLTDVTAFFNTHCYDYIQRKLFHNRSECDLPNMQLVNVFIDRNLLQGIEPITQQVTNINANIIQQATAANVNKALIMASPVLLRPHSRGTIRLLSTDPNDNPAIFPNFLSDERDVEEMLRSIKILEHLVETPEYRAHRASLLHLKLPGCPTYQVDREGYWRCYCRHMTYTLWHAVGSAPLGAVLDERLRVRGVSRLRVADLSALPELPRGNTAAVAIAIGERVADFIIQDNTNAGYKPKQFKCGELLVYPVLNFNG